MGAIGQSPLEKKTGTLFHGFAIGKRRPELRNHQTITCIKNCADDWTVCHREVLNETYWQILKSFILKLRILFTKPQKIYR
jgi:hypothetical protein